MSKVNVMLLFVLLPMFLFSQSVHEGIWFEPDMTWDQIVAKASKENKMIFVDIYTTWCGPCKKMEKEIYTNDAVAKYFNEKFISVKIQFDSTANDSKRIKQWRKTAKAFSAKYTIEGYPTFLFLNSSGELINKNLGFKSPQQFIQIAKETFNLASLNVELKRYQEGFLDSSRIKEMANYAYRIGNRKLARELARIYLKSADMSRPTMEIIQFCRNVANDSKLTDSLSLIFKHKYFDALSDKDLLQPDVLAFTYSYLLKFCRPSDRLFYLSCYKPDLINKLFMKNAAQNIQCAIIFNVIDDEVKKLDNQPPDWHKILNNLKIYPATNCDSVLWDYKIGYYQTRKDWPNYTASIINRVKKYGEYGLGGRGENVDFNFNNLAWQLFLHSNDSSELMTALKWADSAVKIQMKTPKKIELANFMDTKANILYKIGRSTDALKLENEIVVMEPGSNEFKENLSKMKKGLPTW